MAEATPALEIRNLHKRYGDLEVLKGISPVSYTHLDVYKRQLHASVTNSGSFTALVPMIT